MSVFAPMPLPDFEGQKQNILAQLMQQHQQAAGRFAGHASGLGLNNPLRGVASLVQPKFGLRGVNSPQPGAQPVMAFGPTMARLRSAGV